MNQYLVLMIFLGGMNVANVTYSLTTVKIDNNDYFVSAIFTITFDEGISHNTQKEVI